MAKKLPQFTPEQSIEVRKAVLERSIQVLQDTLDGKSSKSFEHTREFDLALANAIVALGKDYSD